MRGREGEREGGREGGRERGSERGREREREREREGGTEERREREGERGREREREGRNVINLIIHTLQHSQNIVQVYDERTLFYYATTVICVWNVYQYLRELLVKLSSLLALRQAGDWDQWMLCAHEVVVGIRHGIFLLIRAGSTADPYKQLFATVNDENWSRGSCRSKG